MSADSAREHRVIPLLAAACDDEALTVRVGLDPVPTEPSRIAIERRGSTARRGRR